MKKAFEVASLIGTRTPSEHGNGFVKFVGMRPHSEYVRIANMPTVRDNNHESVYRSWNILRKVKELLSAGVPGDTVLELIYLMETDTVEVLEDTPPADTQDAP